MPITIVLMLILLNIFSIHFMGNLEDKNRKVILITEYGEIEILLYEKTPLHSDNFINLAKEGFYNGLLFHRVVDSFVIQGGDPTSRNASKGVLLGRTGPGYTIPAEIIPEYYHKKGAVAAARQPDNINPFRESSGSQFYIVTGTVINHGQLNYLASQGNRSPFSEQMINDYTGIGGTPHLDGAYTVFGEVIRGIDVVEKISLLEVDPYSRPLHDVKFNVKITE